MIIRDNRPFLVLSFGKKYQGPNASKYVVEGRYHVPVDYKVIIKWEEDEIVFMTRQVGPSPGHTLLSTVSGGLWPRVPDHLPSKVLRRG